MLPNDNVSMSVGHLDHVLIVYVIDCTNWMNLFNTYVTAINTACILVITLITKSDQIGDTHHQIWSLCPQLHHCIRSTFSLYWIIRLLNIPVQNWLNIDTHTYDNRNVLNKGDSEVRWWLSVGRSKVTTRNQYASPLRGNAIPAGPLSDFDENLFRWWISKSVLSIK